MFIHALLPTQAPETLCRRRPRLRSTSTRRRLASPKGGSITKGGVDAGVRAVVGATIGQDDVLSAAVSRGAVRSTSCLPSLRGISSVQSPVETPSSASLRGLVSHARSGDTSSPRNFVANEKTARLLNLWGVRTSAGRILSAIVQVFGAGNSMLACQR